MLDQYKKVIDILIQNQRLNGSLILAGPQGVGREKLAQYIINKTLSQEALAYHLTVVEPVLDDKKVKAKEISVEQIRKALEFMSYKKVHSLFSVCLIRGAERLSSGAQNALLKAIEEPKEGNLFILIVEHSERLLETIKSRSLILNINLSSPQAIYEKLMKISSEETSLLATLSAWGRSALAHDLIEKPETLEKIKTNLQELQKLITLEDYEKINFIEDQFQNPEEVLPSLDTWINLLTIHLESYFHDSFNLFHQYLKLKLDYLSTGKLLKRMLETRARIKYDNVNVRLNLETTFLNIN